VQSRPFAEPPGRRFPRSGYPKFRRDFLPEKRTDEAVSRIAPLRKESRISENPISWTEKQILHDGEIRKGANPPERTIPTPCRAALAGPLSVTPLTPAIDTNPLVGLNESDEKSSSESTFPAPFLADQNRPIHFPVNGEINVVQRDDTPG